MIKTRLHFPQTNVFVYCRELYFEGDDACIDTQPVATEYRASLDKDGADGTKAGDISLYIQRFGTTEKEKKEYDLKLMSVAATDQLDNEGRNLVVVALIKAEQDTELIYIFAFSMAKGKKSLIRERTS